LAEVAKQDYMKGVDFMPFMDLKEFRQLNNINGRLSDKENAEMLAEYARQQNEYVEQLKQSISLVDFINIYEGSNAYKKGNYLQLHSDPSVMININQNSMKDFGGDGAFAFDPINYLTQYKKTPFPEAIEIVESVANFTYIPNKEYTPREQHKPQDPPAGRAGKGEFIRPPQARKQVMENGKLVEKPTNAAIIKYLIEDRKIDQEIVLDLIHKGKIYETHDKIVAKINPQTGKPFEPRQPEIVPLKIPPKQPSIVFLGELNKDGKITYAGVRSLDAPYEKNGKTISPFRGDVLNSDKSYNFTLMANPPQGQATAVSIFEAPIDALSGATLAKMQGDPNNTAYSSVHFLSLSGVASSKALTTFLAQNPQVTTINICLDNDVGNAVIDRINKEIKQMGEKLGVKYTVKLKTPKIGKDFNDVLKHKVEQLEKQSEQSKNLQQKNTAIHAKQSLQNNKAQQRKAKPKNKER